MAYDRVNWQNQPSTATPINADNLNKMDSGIKALEEGKIPKSDIVQTDTINDPNKVPSTSVTHALGQQVTQLNNKLGNKVGVVETASTSAESIETQLEGSSLYLITAAIGTINGTPQMWVANVWNSNVIIIAPIFEDSGHFVLTISEDFKLTFSQVTPRWFQYSIIKLR